MAIITKPYGDFQNNTTTDANKVDAQLNTLYNDYNGNIDSSNLASGGLNDSTKFTNEVITQALTKGVVYTQDLYGNAFVITGGVVTADGTTANKVNVTALQAYVSESDGSLRRVSLSATSFSTTQASMTYYLDLQPDATYSWGTGHSAQTGYMTVAQVTSDASGNVGTVTDKRNLTTYLKGSECGINSVSYWL